MRELEERNVKYIGYAEPKSLDEVYIEISGLENCVKQCEFRIANLKQSVLIGQIKNREMQAKEEKQV